MLILSADHVAAFVLLAAGGRPHPDRVPPAVRTPTRSPTRRSTRRTPATSGTWSTGRTGRSASRCSAGCPRGPTPTAGSRRWRTTAADIRRWLLPRLGRGGRVTLSESTTSSSGSARWAARRPRQLARRGHSVLGLEQFELGHHRGASHDTSRILRHSYHTPGVRPADPRGVRRLGAASRRSRRRPGHRGRRPRPVPAGAGDPAGRLRRVADRGRHRRSSCSTPPRSRSGGRSSRCPTGTVGLLPGRDGAIVPAGPGTAVMQELARAARRRAARPVAGHRVVDRATAGSRSSPAARSYLAAAVVVVRGRVDQRGCWRRSGVDAAADGHAASRRRTSRRSDPAASRRTGCRCGSGWTSRRSTASRLLRRADRQGRPGLRRAGGRPGRPRRRAGPGMLGLLAGHVGRTAARCPAGRCGHCAASTP